MKLKIAGLVLVCASFTSSAITLGRMQGVAFLGQPLDVAIQVQFEGDETAASSCFDAEVFHADTRLDPSRVRVTVENISQNQLAVIKVVSSTVVDEPIVTVYLKVGCNAKTTRRYVLFAEIPNDIQPSAAALGLRATPLPLVTAPVTTPAPVVQPTPAAVPPAVPSASVPAVAAQTPAPVAKTETVVSPKPAAPAAPKAMAPASPVAPAKPKAIAVEKPTAATAPSQSRLKLDTLELLKERVAQLESTPPPAPVPSPDAELEAQRMKKLEGDVQALLALASKNEKNLAEMRERLLKAESSRYDNALVYGLVGLLLLAVGLLVYLLRNRKSSVGPGSLWSESVQETAAAPSKSPNSAAVPAKPVSIVIPSTFATLDVDLDAIEASDSKKGDLTSQATLQASITQPGKIELPAHPERRSIGRDFSPSVTAALRSINSEELFDIRQQAEFFVSLGQTDQAIDVLNNLIQDGGELSPMVYLDLLKIFHNLGRRADYTKLSQEFNRTFNGRVPDFDHFGNEGKDLEAYRRVISHISALWPSEKVLEALEECIYREDSDDSEQFFDLAAFRDLILLHAVAVLVIEETHAHTTIEMSDRRLALTKEMPMSEAPTHFDNMGNSAKTQPGGLTGLGITKYSSQAPDLDLNEVDFDFSRPHFVAIKEGLKEVEAADTDFEPPEARKNATPMDSKKS